MMHEPYFLDVNRVQEIHRAELELGDGVIALRDISLLESAVAAAQNLFYYGEPQDLYELAAAYAFHIAENQPYVDGNKRTALATALVFLDLNGARWPRPAGKSLPDKLYDAMIAIAERTLDREGLAQVFRELATA